MPVLEPTNHIATITWLGHVPDRKGDLASTPQDAMRLTFAGPEGEDHGGLTRPACSRVVAQHPRGTEIRNTRQLSVVSAEELAAIADAMGLEQLDPTWLGASMVIEGIDDFTHLPPSSRLQAPDGTTLVIDMLNAPCHLPAKVIDRHVPGHGRSFKPAASGLRGVTAWVEREGTVHVGDTLRLHVPGQRPWNGDRTVSVRSAARPSRRPRRDRP